MAAIAQMLGTPLMDWQRQVVDTALEVDPETGLLAYREVVITTPRQSGKTTLVLGFECERCLTWDEPQRVAYTAQTGFDARRKLIEDQAPVLQRSAIRDGIRKVNRGVGNEGIWFKNDSRITVMASTTDAGHGSVIDLGVVDECWRDEDDRREQALLPAMSTRPDAQILLTTTQGTDKSVYLNRKVERGRAAVSADSGSGLAYFEWSLPLEADIEDPASWWEYMPALGWTISEATVLHALRTMEETEWRRAYANQPTIAKHDSFISPELWKRCLSKDGVVDRSLPLVFGIDVLPDRTRGSIAVSDGATVELVESRPGIGWIIERAKELAGQGTLAVDGGGPAFSVAEELERQGTAVYRMSNTDVILACARFYDAVADGRVKVAQSGPLDDASAGLAKKAVGDRFVWSRTNSESDVTPLYAATLAFAAGGRENPASFAETGGIWTISS